MIAMRLHPAVSSARRLTGDLELCGLLGGLQVIDLTVEALMPRDADRPEGLEALRER